MGFQSGLILCIILFGIKEEIHSDSIVLFWCLVAMALFVTYCGLYYEFKALKNEREVVRLKKLLRKRKKK